MLNKISPADPQVLPAPVVNLEQLANEVRAAHTAVGHAARNVLEHALTAGEALLKAKATVPHGRWLPWLKSECDLSERMAQNYMAIAQGRDTIAKTQRVADLSLRGALRLLKPPSPKTSGNRTTPTKATKFTSFDALGWWAGATLEARRHFLDGVGLDPFMAAMPETWRAKLEHHAASNGEPECGTAATELPPPSEAGFTDDPKKTGIPPFLQIQNRPSLISKPQDMPLTGKAALHAIASPSADEFAELNTLAIKIREIQIANLNRKPCEFRKLDRLRDQHAVLAKRLGVYNPPAFEGDGLRP